MIINKVILYLALFQYVGVFPGIDTQPNFIVFAILSFFLLSYSISINELFFGVVISLFILVGFLFHSNDMTMKFAATYIVSVVTAFFSYVGVKKGYWVYSYKVIAISLTIYVIFAVFQFIWPDFGSFLVTRSEEAALSLSQSGRGVRSLTGEPAHFGKIIFIMNIMFVSLLSFNKDNSKKIILISFLCFILNAVLSRSSYSVFFHFISIVILVCTLNKKVFFYGLITLILASIGVIYSINVISYEVLNEIRIFRIFYSLVYDLDYILSQGAVFRLLNIPVTLNNMSFFPFFGSGASQEVFDASLNLGIAEIQYFARGRVYGGILEFVLKFGVFGIPMVILVVFSIIHIVYYEKLKLDNQLKLTFYYFYVLVVLFFQDGSMSQPLLWILIFNLMFSKKLKSRHA